MNRRAVVLGLASLLLGCRRAPRKAHGVSRVVSLSPSTTEAVAKVGGLALLVGRSRYCDYPPEVLALPDVGGYVDPNVEAILALHPDLVVGARGPAGRGIDDTLRARGIETYFPKDDSFADVLDMIRGVGERIGHAKEAEGVAQNIQAHLGESSARTKNEEHPRVLLLFGVQPIVAAGPGSFGDELLAHAGARNALSSGGAYPALDIEAVVSADPDVIVDAAAGAEHGGQHIGRDDAAWSHVRAVREGHVITLADEMLLRPGPRIADAVEKLAVALDPMRRY